MAIDLQAGMNISLDRVADYPLRESLDAASESQLTIQVASGESDWDAFVNEHERGTVCHLYGWKRVIESVYRHRAIYLTAMRGDRIVGVCPMVLMKSRLFGNHLTSMPFLDYGGIIATDSEARRKLFEHAVSIGEQEGTRLCLRFDHQPDFGRELSLQRVSMKLKVIPGDVEATWKGLPGSRRNRIRKGIGNGLGFEQIGEKRLGDFYRVYSENMRDLGSPVHSYAFFKAVIREFRDQSFVGVVTDGGRVIGTAFGLRSGNAIWVPWVSSLRSSFQRSPNEFLYWKMIEQAVIEGCDTFDFGRSAIGDGTFEAKRQWGAEAQQLYWVYEPAEEAPKAESYGRMVQLWKRLPLPVANFAGPSLRRQIPG